MNTSKSFTTLLSIALVGVLPSAALAQEHKDHEGMHATQEPAMTAGEVRNIDQNAGKITLKHEHIKHFDMPGMTMVFQVKDKALLSKFKAGDKVKFMVIRETGKFWITDMQPAQ